MKRNMHWPWLIIVFLLIAILVGGVLEVRLPVSPNAHRLLETGGILIIYGVVWIWLDINKQELMEGHPDHQKEGLPVDPFRR